MEAFRKRGAYAKSATFRRAVLDAALQIVAEHGADAATLQQIADQVGRSKAGLLHHFGSRENLLLEIVRHREALDSQRFRPRDDVSLEASIELVGHNATVPGLIALFTVTAALAASDPTPTERREYFQQRYQRNRQGFARRIARAQSEGLLRDDIDPAAAATLVLATMDGLQIQWLLDPGIDMGEHLRSLVTLLGPTRADPRAEGGV